MDILIKGLKKNNFFIKENDSLCIKLIMLFEGHCTLGVKGALEKYGYTEQRYYQLLKQYELGGAPALMDKKRGSDKKTVLLPEVEKQIIRFRFLDPFSSAGVIAQKLNQIGHNVSKRSVERVITKFGLQKKLMF